MSLAGVSLRDLEYLVAVDECRHFGRAAKRCGVSQPALSAQIRKLETWLGVTVFERLPGQVLVTERGAVVLERARAVIAEVQALVEAARAAGEPLAGPFRLGAIPTLGPYLLPHALRPLRERFPLLRLVLSEGRTAELLEALRAGALDAVLACLPQPDRALRAHPLLFEPFLLVHPPGHVPTWHGAARVEDELILLEEGHCLRDQALALCAPAVPRARRQATGLEMLRHMVAAGEGCSLMPALAARALGGIEGLVAYTPIDDAAAGREVGLLVRHTDPRGPHFVALAALLRGAAPPPARPIGGA
jgi:LysR family hydrogen peroxide-inducible transcriptional activator